MHKEQCLFYMLHKNSKKIAVRVIYVTEKAVCHRSRIRKDVASICLAFFAFPKKAPPILAANRCTRLS